MSIVFEYILIQNISINNVQLIKILINNILTKYPYEYNLSSFELL